MRPLLWIVAAAALLAAAPSPGAHAAEVSVGLAAGASVGLGFNGTVCRCHIYSDISGGKTIVEATCTKEFENSPGAETCRCNGMVTAQCVVNPTASNQGKKSIKVNLNSGLCQQYCEENQGNQAVTCSSTTPCSGSSGCPGAAVEVREAFSREVLYEQSALTHMECSHDIEYHACTNALAPCHCRYSEHTDGICVPHAADPCSGEQHHEIVIHQAASGPGAQQCPPDHELNFVSSCRVENCQRDCVTGPWSAWGACDAACGAGQQHRTREVFVTPQGGGAACDVLSESRDCTGVACPVDCTLSEWVNGPCNAVCGEGTYERTRTVTEPAQNDGHCEGVLRQTLPCVGLEPCPVDCRLSDWSAFSACTASCGAEATKTRTRTVTTQPAHGGTACGALSETVPCGHDPCPIDCDVTPFGAWQPCSAPCGTGSRTRSRVVITAPQHGGAACPALTENEVCNAHACECKLGEWSEWSTCSAQCGSGSQERTREILDNPGNATCAPALESRACNVAPCPVNCETSEWGAWAECTEPCGPNGVRRRLRTVVTAPQHNGTACGPLMEEEPCNTHSCPVHCQVGEWTEYGACSSPCGGGTRTRTRAITTPPQGGGSACPALEETVSCNTQVCANCTVGDWGQWSSCSAACGLGKQARNRSVTTPPQPGGTCNAALHEERQCDAGPCPCDCTVGDWSAWSACSEQCGENGGTQTRHRAVTRDAVGKGHACPALNQTRRCNVGAPCEAACQVSAFGAWGDCSAACGGGVQSRTRTVTKPGVGSTAAAACPELSETRVCNEAACPAPATCAAGQWSAWSACSRQCGGGTMSRTRALTRNNTDASPCSLELRQEQACKTAPCPVTCETGAWGDWSSCSSPCGGGVQERVRKVEQPPVSGGGACNPTVEVRECNTQTCGNHTGPCDALPPKCDTDKCRCHSCCADKRPPAWSPCRPKCGGGAGGTQTRVRSCPSCPSSCSEHHNEERACALAKDAAHDTSHCPSKPAMDGAATSKAAATVKTLPGKAPAAASAHRMVPARIVPNTLSPK